MPTFTSLGFIRNDRNTASPNDRSAITTPFVFGKALAWASTFSIVTQTLGESSSPSGWM